MSTESYPRNRKQVIVNGIEVVLQDIPTSVLNRIESKELEDDIYTLCRAGSDIKEEVLMDMGQQQVVAMYRDIMILSYGEGWEKQLEDKTNNPKKK